MKHIHLTPCYLIPRKDSMRMYYTDESKNRKITANNVL